MNWLNAFERWLQKWAKIMVLRGAISICTRIMALNAEIDYLEWDQMAVLAHAVRPKLEKELKEVHHGPNYFNR